MPLHLSQSWRNAVNASSQHVQKIPEDAAKLSWTCRGQSKKSKVEIISCNAGRCQCKQSCSTFKYYNCSIIQPFCIHMAKSGCSSKGKQDQRLLAAHGQVHTYKSLCVHTHIDAHGQRRGVLAEAECVCPLQGRREEREQKSWNKRMLASISQAVERDRGVRKRIHSFCPPNPIHSHSSNPPTPLSPFWKGGGWKGQPPSGSTSPSKLTPTHSDGCLIVRDTGRALSLSNLKQIASPWGRDYWTREMTKQGQCGPLGGGGQRG